MQKDTQSPAKETENKEGLTTDELRMIVAGKTSLEDLAPEKQQEFHERFVLSEEELPQEVQPPDDGGTGNEEEADQQEPQKTPDDVQADKKEDNREVAKQHKGQEKSKGPEPDLKRKYYEKSNELNTTKQRLEQANKRLKDLESIQLKAKKGQLDDDVYSEENLKSQRDEISELRRVVEKLTTGEVEHIKSERQRLQEQTQKLEEQNLYLDIQAFQGENPELKTEKPFHVLNAAYAKFQNDVGGPEARERYFSDADFRKQKEAEGITLPMDEKTWEKYKTLVEVHHFRGQKGYPDYDSAYFKWRKEKGIADDPVKQAALRASRAATEQIVENKTETTTLSPNDGVTGDGGTGMDEKQMLAWLEAHPYPKTAEEQQMQKRILAYVSSASAGG